jgi:hypothetical protein
VRAVEAEYLRQVSAQLVHRVADAARAELAEVREVFAYLRRVQAELVGERLRRDGLDARRRQQIQAAQIHAQPTRRQLRNFLRLHPKTFSRESTGPEYTARGARREEAPRASEKRGRSPRRASIMRPPAKRHF